MVPYASPRLSKDSLDNSRPTEACGAFCQRCTALVTADTEWIRRREEAATGRDGVDTRGSDLGSNAKTTVRAACGSGAQGVCEDTLEPPNSEDVDLRRVRRDKRQAEGGFRGRRVVVKTEDEHVGASFESPLTQRELAQRGLAGVPFQRLMTPGASGAPPEEPEEA